jgi:hypothetical protein
MKRWKRMAYYLLLNVFVSACTVWTALYIWEWRHPGSTGELPLLTVPLGTPTDSGVLSTLQAGKENPQGSPTEISVSTINTGTVGKVTISNIFGTGELDTEKVRITCTGDTSTNLLGWKLVDEDGNELRFPQITIFPNAAIDVYTTAGNDTSQVIYWGLLQPVWSSGETASLFDSQGNLQGTYEAP